nr:hypothetical protein [uncultured Nitrososphaera sp.]
MSSSPSEATTTTTTELEEVPLSEADQKELAKYKKAKGEQASLPRELQQAVGSSSSSSGVLGEAREYEEAENTPDDWKGKPNPMELAATGWKPLGPYNSNEKGKKKYKYIYMQYGDGEQRQRITYQFPGKEVFEEIKSAYENYLDIQDQATRKTAGGAATKARPGPKGVSGTQPPQSDEQLFVMKDNPDAPLFSSLIKNVKSIQVPMLDFGRAAFLMCCMHMKIPREEVMDALMSFDDEDGKKGWKNRMLTFLKDVFESYEDIEIVDELQGKLNLETMKRMTVEDVVNQLTEERNRAVQSYHLAAAVMDESSLRRFMLARMAVDRGAPIEGALRMVAAPTRQVGWEQAQQQRSMAEEKMPPAQQQQQQSELRKRNWVNPTSLQKDFDRYYGAGQ